MSLFKNFINYIKIKNKEKKIFFYSESLFYKNYYINAVEYLLLNKKEVILLTSDLKEYENLKSEFEIIYIGNGILRYLIFNIIKCDMFFLTLTDIGKNLFKSKFCKNYIYYFHAMASTHKIYTSTAFDNFDVILTLGNFHQAEIRERERIFNLKKKKIFNSGYLYFDYLSQNTNLKLCDKNTILFAPSWNYNKKNILNDYGEQIIESLIENNFFVIFRPHPENYKHNKNKIVQIEKKFKSKKFLIDNTPSNIKSMEKAGCLLTDNSAISIEYTLIFKRPSIFLNYSDKIHNKNYNLMKSIPIENTFKQEIAINLDIDQIDNIKQSLANYYNNYDSNKLKINKFLSSNYSNIGNSKQKLLEVINSLS